MWHSPPASYWIEHLQLSPHPEGGYYKEVYRAFESIPHSALPKRFSGARSFATSIYYLLEHGDFSAFHRIRSDETLHFYAGGGLEVVMLHSGSHEIVTLGSNLANGEQLQYTVPAGVWFASRPKASTPYALVGCSVSPGFDFADFELASRSELLSAYSDSHEVITSLTR